MSIKVQLLTLVMCYAIKRLLENLFIEDPKNFRSDIGTVARFAFRLPDEVDVVSEKDNGVPCEWISYGNLSGDQVHLYRHGGGNFLETTAEHIVNRIPEARSTINEISESMKSHMSVSAEVS